MKVLVIGEGAAEHALALKLSQSRQINRIYCCPGNSAIAAIAECIDVRPYDFRTLIDFVKYEWIDLTIVGSQKLFLEGIVNAFEKEGCRILGPRKSDAQCLSSRVFLKNLMRRYRIPTPEYKVFSSYFQAQDYIRLKTPPFVIKTDDFYNHFGIFPAFTIEDAMNALKMIMEEKIFSDAAQHVIVEESFKGNRVSFVTVTDGKTIVPLTDLYTYEDVFKDKRGPFASVTGAYCPTGIISEELTNKIMEQIMDPLLMALKSEGIYYKGLLFADLIYARERPYVFELQSCFPEPETQTILPRLKTDFVDIAFSVIEERLSDITIEWRQESSVCIVVSPTRHMSEDRKKALSNELDNIESLHDVSVFHGSASSINMDTVSEGEMNVSITAIGDDITKAKNKAYNALDKLNLDGMYYRRDIANK
jgi:phosphoribosylamine--glycine ligase